MLNKIKSSKYKIKRDNNKLRWFKLKSLRKKNPKKLSNRIKIASRLRNKI